MAPDHDSDTWILDRPTARRRHARDGLICIFVAVVLLLLLQGASIRNSGEKMDPGVQRTVVLAVGHPAGWLADQLPLDEAAASLTASLSPDDELEGPGGFDSGPQPTASPGAAAPSGAAAPITADAFDPAELGAPPRRLADAGVRTLRDARLGTGISKSDIVDWGVLSTQQAKEEEPDAVVMFMGANEGFPFPGAGGRSIECCGPAWAAAYATRARRMMDTYRRSGAARVYWLTLPMPRDARLREIARSVNAAIDVAAQPFRAQVRVLDMVSVFTPGGRYRAAQAVGGRQTIVRRPDGIHLNDAGAAVALDIVLARVRADFAKLGG